MQDFNSNDKSKNDAYYSPKERGGCLTLFLGFAIIGNILGLLFLLVSFGPYRGQIDGGTSFLIFGLFAIQVGIFMSVIGLWNWKRWGYYGILAGYGVGIVLNFLSANLPTVIGSLIGALILTQLMKDKMDYLE